LKRQIDISTLEAGILQGDIASLSRAITLVESQKETHQLLASTLVQNLLPHTGRAKRIGITGVPGVGKSTFIESFGMQLVSKGYKVAVLAIDPSSTLSKGSILGDKTRMEALSVHPNAFIRPSASSGSLGGLTYKTRETMLLCEAAGYDIVLVETVGVGQSETEVAQITDFFLLLMLAGAGDELQGIKRGIMEMADGMVITKADGANVQKAKNARSEYARALHFFPPNPSGWIPQVKIASSIEYNGIEEVWQMIEQYYNHTTLNGALQQKREQQSLTTFDRLVQERLYVTFLHKEPIKSLIAQLRTKVVEGQASPYLAVQQLFEQL
jgi:LAO/AO transport system kinase